jgi:hypothetical protein
LKRLAVSFAVIAITAGVFTPRICIAQEDVEKVALQYFGVLSFPRGVRSIGMGMTGTADDYDPANAYYNPAVLAFGPGIAVTGGSNNWMEGFDVGDIGVSAAYGPEHGGPSNWHFGAGVRYVRLNAEPSTEVQTTAFDFAQSIDVNFSDWYLASTVAVGYEIDHVDVAAGFAVKYLEIEAISDEKFNTWTYDAGLLVKYNTETSEGVNVVPSLGVSVLNFGGGADSGSDNINPADQVRYGAGLRMEAFGLQESGEPLSRPTPVLAIAVDGELLDFVDTNRKLGSGVGVELSLINILSIRYGYADSQFAYDYGQTFGGGLGYGWGRTWFRLDFAIAFETSQSRNISAVGFLVDVDI